MPVHIRRNTKRAIAVAGVIAATFTTTAHANPINDQVAALPEKKRQMVFARMMQREGEQCPSVSRTFPQGLASDRSAFWSMSCSAAADWQIMIKNTAQGDIKTLDCATLKAAGGGQCFTAFKAKK